MYSHPPISFKLGQLGGGMDGRRTKLMVAMIKKTENFPICLKNSFRTNVFHFTCQVSFIKFDKAKSSNFLACITQYSPQEAPIHKI